jgi:O-antigen/teichoic acid export membrane protein
MSAKARAYLDASVHGRRIIAGALGGGVLMVTTIATAIVHYKLVIGVMPRELAGLWLLFWSLGSYLAFFDLGIGPTLSREIALLPANKDRLPVIEDLAATCLRIYLGVAALLLAVAVIAGWILLPTLELQSISFADAILAWGIFAAGACVNLFSNLSFAVLTGEGEVAKERLTRAFGMLSWLALSSYALLAGYGITGVVLAWLVNAFIVWALAMTVLKLRLCGLSLSRGRWRSEVAHRLARPSGKWALTQLGALLILQTANVVIAWNLGPAAIPSYEAASRVILAAGAIALLGTNASVPFYSRAFAQDDIAGLRRLLYRNVHQALLTMAAAIAVLWAFAPELFSTWLGKGNFVGYAVLTTMAVMMTLEIHHVAHASLVMASGSIPFVRIAILAGALNLLFSIVLVRYIDLLGIAIATMAAQMLTNNWYAPYVSLRKLKVGIGSYMRVMVPRFLGYLALFGSIECAATVILREHSDQIRLGAGIAAAAIVYITILLFVPVPKPPAISGLHCSRPSLLIKNGRTDEE